LKSSTSIKLAIAAVIALFFAGFVFRAALRLAATVTHSAIAMLLLLLMVLWLTAKSR
jgi:hypothetical protein